MIKNFIFSRKLREKAKLAADNEPQQVFEKFVLKCSSQTLSVLILRNSNQNRTLSQ